ncbi:hypothetical protein CCP3SC5AM1_3140001 [Gammaproteobacteria bacterium]
MVSWFNPCYFACPSFPLCRMVLGLVVLVLHHPKHMTAEITLNAKPESHTRIAKPFPVAASPALRAEDWVGHFVDGTVFYFSHGSSSSTLSTMSTVSRCLIHRS